MSLLRTVLTVTAASLLSLTGAALPAGAIPTSATTGAAGLVGAERAADPPPAPKRRFTIRDDRVDDSSGLARSQKYEGIWWTVNDAGENAVVHGIDATGKVRVELGLKATVKDVEAISVDRNGTIYVADIGDNKKNRDMIEVYTIPEPSALEDESAVRPRRYDFEYPDGAHDAETMLIDPGTGRLFFVTKVASGKSGIYAAPEQASREGTNELTKIADGPAGVTDGVFLPDGSQVVLRSLTDLATMEWGDEPNVIARTATPSAQGDAVGLSDSGDSVLIGSKTSAVYDIAVPSRKPAAAPTSPKATPAPAAASDSGETKKNHNLRWIIVGAALFAILITFLTFPPGRRERLDRMAENARLTGQPPPDPHGRRRAA
ncbi:hypothetical protein BWI15_15160 [Kribbella sp. ALI-6-A]|uniref:hypothetical protein n=1 Tax=Kribbella sp. ALI-6-A TaxID=1933817 RepID=UPI00097C76C4|nr:hypothetical protein [Kribbella sp. ALI-6-A]ONI71515.1 hypothetical protein BWI15_15160 [Kribbella sp. ALI-6-A]